ncbi:MAG: CBS domain-containing protein [Polyangiaceae bacterium]
MARKSPTVSELMSRHPEELDRRDSVQRAAELMHEHGIHHLPILEGTRLFGILSSRDVEVVTITVGHPDRLEVGDVCITDPYTVPPTASVKDVARVMMDRHIGSAVVVDAGVVVGIFTVTDALRALVDAYGG